MTEVRFYHLTSRPIAQALPELLEKTLARGMRAVVRLDRKNAVEPLAEQLWQFNPTSFLPHGTAQDGQAAHQPVWLTAQAENPNNAQVLFLLGSAQAHETDLYDLICHLFSEADAPAVELARQAWKRYKADGKNLTYWQQTAQGWQKKETS
ncbi:MAG: DNA polymerase III subunit chi [Alphaproteobacteria bacterium]|nr:DNA polymerase III subunit chi [Alphaproteobacteria bacterium]